ncbi:MAG TPA: TraR/DksA family transcriptional regulator [Streptosporangiaceae bacterium]
MTAAHHPPLVRMRIPGWPAFGPSAAGSRQGNRLPAGPDRTDAVAALPASRWRELLEKRWQARLSQVTELSLAFYETGERTSLRADDASTRELRRLQWRTVAARRALADTEEALGRLSAGHYGHCEQCGADIPARRLVSAPEARYCPRCSPSTAMIARIVPAAAIRNPLTLMLARVLARLRRKPYIRPGGIRPGGIRPGGRPPARRSP